MNKRRIVFLSILIFGIINLLIFLQLYINVHLSIFICILTGLYLYKKFEEYDNSNKK